MAVMRLGYHIAVWLVLAAGLAAGATLEQLNLDQMIEKSTSIVQGKVASTSTLVRNSVIYTCYQVQVVKRWKGLEEGRPSVCVAGGAAQGVRQTFPGAPKLELGQDYVLFLWAGKSGMNQLIGLSQGVFDLRPDGKGQLMASRPAITETMLDAAGREVNDSGVTMRLRDLDARIERKLAAGGRK